MSLFKITIKAGNPATYDPNPQIVFVNDSVFWFNSDPNEAHWPAPSTKDPTGFMATPVAAGSSSDQVGFGEVQDIPYICINHPGEESGQINVRTPKQSTFGKKTKKGGFGGTTKKGAFGNTTK